MDESKKLSKGIALAPGKFSDFVPEIVISAGPKASKHFLEFFAAQIRNKNTREADFRNVTRFYGWCEERGIPFLKIEPNSQLQVPRYSI